MRQSPEAGVHRTVQGVGSAQTQDLAAAQHRAGLRMRVEICAALRRNGGSAMVGAAVAVALRLGEEAAAELAGIPDTSELRRRDAVLLEKGGGPRDGCETEMRQLVEVYRRGRPFDLFTASPVELLASCVARAGAEFAWG
jgi:hypothetical protein